MTAAEDKTAKYAVAFHPLRIRGFIEQMVFLAGSVAGVRIAFRATEAGECCMKADRHAGQPVAGGVVMPAGQFAE